MFVTVLYHIEQTAIAKITEQSKISRVQNTSIIIALQDPSFLQNSEV